jgi:hypothetical protein
VLISSFAYVTNLIPFMATIPILLPNNELVGTGFGVWQSFVSATTRNLSPTLLTRVL